MEVNNTTTGLTFQPTTEVTTNQTGTSTSTTKEKKVQKAGKYYELKKMLGQSYICRVHLADDIRDGKQYALKCYPKKIVKAEQKLEVLRREVAILQKCRHRYIQALREVVHGESHFYIVVEFVAAILTDKVVDSQFLPEDIARKFFQKIIVALRHCHRNGVVHRDLKLDKILVADNDDIKITGFDVAEFQKPGELLPTCFNTFSNSSPEILSGQDFDGFASDVFSSVSSLLFPMLFGVHPFENAKKSVTFTNIENCEFSFPTTSTVSDAAKDLISKVLVQDPEDRLTIEQIIHHPWFQKDFDESQLSWGRESTGVARAQSQLEDTAELGKLNFDDDDDEKNNKSNKNNENGSPGTKTTVENASFTTTNQNGLGGGSFSTAPSSQVRNITGDESLDKLLSKFPPNFIFASSDIDVVSGGSIGAGGAGSVFKAKIKSVGWDVAAKLFRERESVEKAITESEQSLKLRHKNLVQTVGLAVAKSAFSVDLVMLMELADESLDSWLRKEISLHEQQQRQQESNIINNNNEQIFFEKIWDYAKQITEGLAFLHSRNPRILHLDMKPSNVVLFQRGAVAKICDLGISRVCGGNNNNNNNNSQNSEQNSPLSADVTRIGVGTLRYCSRQQLTSSVVDAQCDVYSLGATIFAMIDETWEPWKGKSVGEITQGNLSETLNPRAGCPQKLIDLCKSCIEPDLALRPKDTIEVFVKFFAVISNNDGTKTSKNNNNNNELPDFLKEYFETVNERTNTANSMTLDELLLGGGGGTSKLTFHTTGGSSACGGFTPSSGPSRNQTTGNNNNNNNNNSGDCAGNGNDDALVAQSTETFEGTSTWGY